MNIRKQSIYLTESAHNFKDNPEDARSVIMTIHYDYLSWYFEHIILQILYHFNAFI